MDTICYLYPRRERESGEKPCYTRQEFDMPDYRLVRYALSRSLWEILKEADTAQEQTKTRTARLHFSIRYHKQKAQQEKLRQQRLRLATAFLQELPADPDHTRYVCREPLSFCRGREFNDYLQEEWIQHLLRYGWLSDRSGKKGLLLPDVILLGRVSCLPGILEQSARYLRSLRWYLTARQYHAAEQSAAEFLEQEYGLLAEVRLLEKEEDLRRIRLTGIHPCQVWDFCEEERICGTDLAAGSLWLDFTSSEEKHRRLEERCPQVSYFSLKKEWKQPQKALDYLDTISKIKYNT